MTNIKIYQGNQIGGCITEISTDTTKIIIDLENHCLVQKWLKILNMIGKKEM